MKKLVVLIFYIHCCQLFPQEHIVFSSINANKGLSDNGVRGICQLNDGRMVIVTWGLVNIYDGSGFLYLHYSDREAYPLSNFYGWHLTYIDKTDNIWLKNQYKLYLFDVKKEKFVTNIDSIFYTYGIKDHVTDLFIDTECNSWFITDKNELFLKKSNEKKADLFITDVLITNNPDDQLIDIDIVKKELFLFYKSGTMVCCDFTTREEIYRDNPFTKDGNLYTQTIGVVPYNEYLYQVRNGYWGGLSLRFNISTRKWDKIIETGYWQNTLTLDSTGNCWISSFQGLWLIDKNLENKRLISPIQLVDGRLFETEITTQYNDNNGGLWVGSINRGLLYYHPDRFKFRNFGRTFFNLNDNEKLRVNCFSEINDDVLVGTQKGVYKYNKKTGSLAPYKPLPVNAICKMFYKDGKQHTWICTENNGLFEITDENIKHYSKPVCCLYIYEALDGRYYLCTDNGFGIFEPSTGNFERIETPAGLNLIPYYFNQYGKNKLLGFSSAGLFIYNCIDKTITFPDREKETIFQQDNYLYHCIYNDSRGLFWFGTQDGLYVYDSTANSMQSFHEKDGLVNNAIRSIIEDNLGKIWVSTSYGISCIHVSGNKTDYHYSFVNYNHFDGVIENEFLPRSVIKTSDNYLLWGGLDGFNEINLNRIDSSKQHLSKPLITKFMLFGTEIKVGEKYNRDIILNQSVSATKQIELKHFQNFLGFEFSALNYVNPTQTYYRYRLEGVDASWNETISTTGVGIANYTNVSPGTYKLKVFAANNSKQWGDKYTEMTIVIHPPFWKTTLAYTFYFLLFLITVYLVVSYLIRMNRQKMDKRHKEALDQMKFSFFTNVSHELRTPLTLILTPLGSILKKTDNEQLKKQLTGVYRNAKDLLKIVNQLLDFRKLEMKGESLELTYCNVSEFLETIVFSFKELANEKEINFSFECTEKNIHAYIDKDKLNKIVNNLLSNAFKFTSNKGSITLKIKKERIHNLSSDYAVRIQVTDSGCGIPEKELTQIFDRFYQAKNRHGDMGSGIGLYLVKEYVQLHNGVVGVESRIDEGSTFTIDIPIKMPTTDEKLTGAKKKEMRHSLKVLVVDDSVEFRSFLFSELSEKYEVLLASNGIEGLEKTREYQPDLVITDLIMPEMSGTELCRNLKNDLQISHIPVILLTARISDEAQIESFESRADAYITKPFNMDILLLRIQNLIEQQEERKNLFKKTIVINTDSFTLTNIDEELIKKAIGYIEENMNKTSYSVEQLSKDMCMDRTGLYRKLLAILGQTPTDFIRSIRLKKAAQFLEKGISVNEVSEKTGFGNTSYFIKCFKKEFGIRPSQYKRNRLAGKIDISD